MLQIIKADEVVATAINVQEAMAWIEDDAVSVWSSMRDPNQPGAQLFPGVDWDGRYGWLELEKGGIEYSIIDPYPFYSWAIDYDHETGQPYCLVVYDNQASDYPHSTEFVLWL